MNAGQTCIAPDYVLCHKQCHREFIQLLKAAIEQFYGPNPQESPDYARLINVAAFDRVQSYLQDGTLEVGGNSNREELFLSPTILTDVPVDAPVMQQEIFGPVLPVLRVESLDDAIAFVNQRPTCVPYLQST